MSQGGLWKVHKGLWWNRSEHCRQKEREKQMEGCMKMHDVS